MHSKRDIRNDEGRSKQYQLFSDVSRETITFEGELIAEVETPIFLFPETRNWNKRVIKLYKTTGNSYVYHSKDQWSKSPCPETPHQNIMKFDDINMMVCVLLQDFGDNVLLDADTRLIIAAMERDERIAAEIEAIGEKSSRRRARRRR